MKNSIAISMAALLLLTMANANAQPGDTPYPDPSPTVQTDSSVPTLPTGAASIYADADEQREANRAAVDLANVILLPDPSPTFPMPDIDDLLSNEPEALAPYETADNATVFLCGVVVGMTIAMACLG